MSNEIAIQIDHLSKSFGWRASKRVQAVKNLALEIKAGQVYGFLGPNGAGKTTTIRMILDLVRPNSGDVYLFGKHVRREREILSRVGSLVEGALFYNFLTGRRNLEVMALTSNLEVSTQEIDRLLAQVELTERSRRKVKGYSTGMKQRLGLAAALLGNPDLIILDEPTNGLDPHGIQEVRRFIRDLADKEGKTVFLSSHMLNEVEQVCDRVAIINKGELIREGRVSELLESQTLTRVEAEPLEKATAILSEHWTVSPDGKNGVIIDATRRDVPQVVEKLVENEIKIYQVTTQHQSLEEYFLSVTEGDE